jgi:hypothetical protein
VGLRLFPQGLGQDVFVEGEVGDAFEARILVLERPQLPQLADAQVRVSLLPDVEGGFAHAELPADVGDGAAAFDPTEALGDLLLGELRLLHGPRFCVGTVQSR